MENELCLCTLPYVPLQRIIYFISNKCDRLNLMLTCKTMTEFCGRDSIRTPCAEKMEEFYSRVTQSLRKHHTKRQIKHALNFSSQCSFPNLLFSLWYQRELQYSPSERFARAEHISRVWKDPEYCQECVNSRLVNTNHKYLNCLAFPIPRDHIFSVISKKRLCIPCIRAEWATKRCFCDERLKLVTDLDVFVKCGYDKGCDVQVKTGVLLLAVCRYKKHGPIPNPMQYGCKTYSSLMSKISKQMETRGQDPKSTIVTFDDPVHKAHQLCKPPERFEGCHYITEASEAYCYTHRSSCYGKSPGYTHKMQYKRPKKKRKRHGEVV